MEIIERVVSGSGGTRTERPLIVFLIAIAVDDHLTIRFPVALLDDCCLAGLVLLDYGCSFAISVAVAVIGAHRHSGSNWANSDTDADILRACGHCGAYACRCNYCQYVLHESLLALCETHAHAFKNGISPPKFRSLWPSELERFCGVAI